MDIYRQYCLVGGMPEAVQAWLDCKNVPGLRTKIQHDLLTTYRDDFHKYGGEIDARLLNRILLSVAEQLGNKFVYSMVDPGVQTPVVEKALDVSIPGKGVFKGCAYERQWRAFGRGIK